MKNIFNRSIVITLALAALGTAGCRTQTPHLSALMEKTSPPALTPPSGKSLVLIHRPLNAAADNLYTGIWDGTNFIADLGSGNSVAFGCEPGTHYFINRSIQNVGVVEAQLLADQTYDLRVDFVVPQFVGMMSFQLEPMKRGDKERTQLPKWEKENFWVSRGANAKATEHERLTTSEIEIILRDFVSGQKKNRLRHLDAEEHR